MDARGQTATGCQEVNLAASPPSPAAHHDVSMCTYFFFFFFALFTNVVLHISTEPPTRLKVLPEVRARGKAREGEIEDERGVIESLHKTHPSRVQQ